MAAPVGLFKTVSSEIEALVERTAPAVVRTRREGMRSATGLVFAAELVLTISRGLEPGSRTDVAVSDDSSLVAEPVGRDPSTGLTVLKVAGLDVKPLEPALNVPRVGSLVLSLGRSWSGGIVAAAGLVSSVGGPLRTGRGPAIERVVRTSITPYAGFVGGPLVDADGAVAGIGAPGVLRGLAFAMPAALVWPAAQALAAHGAIKRGYLGIASQAVRIPERQRPGSGRDQGLMIVNVASDSPAERAGLLVGDIVLAFDRVATESPEELLDLLDEKRVGKVVAVDISRGGVAATVDVTVGERLG